jgi:nucleotide-binding universal stress UspA family protein
MEMGGRTRPPGGEDPMFKSILIPTDGSELSQRAVRSAVELAKLHQARLTGMSHQRTVGPCMGLSS